MDEAQSKKSAQEFRAWINEHGTAQQKDAAGRVQRIIGEGNEKTGNACISADQGYASVYDVFGNAMITNYTF